MYTEPDKKNVEVYDIPSEQRYAHHIHRTLGQVIMLHNCNIGQFSCMTTGTILSYEREPNSHVYQPLFLVVTAGP
jgi:hypothetical protein